MTAAELRKLLHYDPDTGSFTWRVTRGPTARAGSKAGSLTDEGYIRITVLGVACMAHRLAWLYVHGEWPPKGIDHRDGDESNNRIANLRPADQTENNANRKQHRNNTSGIKGVFWDKEANKWCAKIRVRGTLKNLGRFTDREAAAEAYRLAADQLFGAFARATRSPRPDDVLEDAPGRETGHR